MFEYAAFGFVTLVWWTWPVIGAITFTAVYAAYRLAQWQEHRYERRTGRDVQPCLAHMGTTADGIEHWCWQQDGHKEPHHNQWGVPQSDFDDDELDREFPPDRGPVKVGPHLCPYNEDGHENAQACWKMEGHDGPHMLLDQ